MHGVTDGGSDTVETTIVYGVQTVQDTTLHWFQAVIDVRNGTVAEKLPALKALHDEILEIIAKY